MKLTYETGIASYAQFIVVSLLNIVTGLNSVVTVCHTGKGNCLNNSLTSVAYFLLVVTWFAAVWQLGYAAQRRRSRRLCQLLIVVEGLVFVVALFNAKHHNDILGLMASLIDAGLAVWVSILAIRLIRARGGRIIASERSRRKHRGDTRVA